jgi:hypothetical protein
MGLISAIGQGVSWYVHQGFVRMRIEYLAFILIIQNGDQRIVVEDVQCVLHDKREAYFSSMGVLG